MKIFTTYPVTIDKKRINAPEYYLNADGDEYIPFDGKTELDAFQDETGETFYCSADGENFYNAKGQKLKGIFKKVGKGVVKAGKFIGKVAKKVGRAVVKASKSVAKGVKTAGGKVKAGAKKLIHHKTKEERTQSKADRDKKRANRKKEHDEKIAKRNKEIEDAKAKGKTPPPKIEPLKVETLDKMEKEEELKFTQKEKAEENKTPDANATDVFTLTLPLANANTPKDKIVVINGKEYDASGIPDNKQIVQTIDENGNPIAGVEYDANEVVAVTGTDGNIEYHTQEAVGGMSKGVKVALIVGGSLLVLSIVAFVIYKSQNVNKIK
jgi:hypothetical protein